MKRSGLILATDLLSCLLVEGVARLALRLLETDRRLAVQRVEARLVDQTDRLRGVLAAQDRALLRLDAELGWDYASSMSRGIYRSNRLGPAARESMRRRRRPAS